MKGRSSVQIMVGMVPLLLVAGVIEAFMSPSNTPGVAKALLGLSVALALSASSSAASPVCGRSRRHRQFTPQGLPNEPA